MGNLKDDDNNNSSKRSKVSSTAAAAASGSTDSSGGALRRSSRETPSKKQTTSSASPTPSIRKSQRIENRTSPTTPTPPACKKKLPAVSGTTTTKKKRLDARTYRASLLKINQNKPNYNNGYTSLHPPLSAKPHLNKVHPASTPQGRPLSADNSFEKVYALGTTKRKRKSGELDSDASLTPANEDTNSSRPLPSLPSQTKTASVLERCYACCSKRQRFEADTQKCSVCSCNKGNNSDTCNNSSPEEIREQTAGVPNPENGGMHMNCTLNDDNKLNMDQTDINSREDAHIHGSELLLEAERNHVQDQTDVHTKVEISNPLGQDGSESLLDSERRSEECCNKVPLKESSLDTHKACVVCKLGGELLCCDGKGCKRNYHLYCLDPPFKVKPYGVWHCSHCVQSKIHSGVHSVSEGVESICDVREVDVPDSGGIQKQKQYLVKYKGLAHVHNLWIPEHQLLLEAPLLVSRLKKNQVVKWKPEWTKPQRLVQKRFLLSENQRDENLSECQCEWFVKWTGLGYEYATWELENAPFLRSPEAIKLKKDYGSRLKKARWAANPSTAKLLEERKHSSSILSKLPIRSTSGQDNDHLNFINKVREYWHKNQNAVVIEDQERISNVVLLILSMQPDVCRPFLIISTSSSISAWEDEFMRAEPSVNVVVYNGNKKAKECMRALEFYEEGGCVLPQVLISTVDDVTEDFGALEVIGWEAIIVDECQRSSISRHFDQIKKLINGFSLLLFSGSIKESVAVYLSLLSFLESGGDRNGDVSVKADSVDTIPKLKERFNRFVACDRKSDSSKFIEYWVPVQLSNVQLEQYCATLLSASVSLCSFSKNDPVGALRDILISVRKCCDHPYLVDQSLQSLLTKNLPEVEYLDVGVNASGKLQVLDKILPEIRNRGLRVLILFQSIGGSGRNNIGDILDDFLRQRFGPDSYERVDSGLLPSKKQAALNMFNDKQRGRFVFLIENRACLPSIKLTSVDMVLLFDSDWNPSIDLRALQKITIDSNFEELKVFRLYSSCTVEERVLSLAKQDLTLDSNIQNISCSTSHTLLLWGAYFLFQKLDEFHSGCTPSSGLNVKESFLSDIVQEFLSQLPDNSKLNEMKNCKIVLKAQLSGSSYSKDTFLLGEKEMESRDDELPHVLWTKVLEGRYPRWRYSSGPSQRIRRKVHYYDESSKKSQENDEVARKRKKFVSNAIDQNTPKTCLGDKQKSLDISKEGASATPCDELRSSLESKENANLLSNAVSDQLKDLQKSLHLSLKPVIGKLCEILQLPDEIKNMAEKFLEYVMNKSKVTREPVTMFQAFQISLCWSAASILNYKISHKKSLSIANKHLDFRCKDEETQAIYLKLRELRKEFSLQANCVGSISADNSSPRDREMYSSHLMAPQLKFSPQQELEEGEIGESPKSHKCPIQVDTFTQKQPADTENTSGSPKSGVSNIVEQVETLHRQRMKQLYQKQMEEFENFKKSNVMIMDKEKKDLDLKHKLESALICSLNNQLSVRSEKLKKIDQEFARKKDELNHRVETKQKSLLDMQLTARNEEMLMKVQWLEEAKSGKSVDAYALLPLSDSRFRVEHMDELEHPIVGHDTSAGLTPEHVNTCEQGGVTNENTASYRSSVQIEDDNGVVSVLSAEAVHDETCAIVPCQVDEIAAEHLTLHSGKEGVEVNALVSEIEVDMGSMQQRILRDSDVGLLTLGQTLVGPPLDHEHTVSSEEGQVPSVQVPVNENAQPSLQADVVQVGQESGCEVRNSSEVEIQVSLLADAVLNQVNGDTPGLPPLVQLQLSSSSDPWPTGQSQLGVPACTLVDKEQINVSFQQFKAPTQALGKDQDVAINFPCLLPVNQSSHSASQETQVSAPSSDTHSPEHSHCDVAASTCVARSSPLPDNLFSHAASQQSHLPGPSADPPSTEQSQPVVTGSMLTDPSAALPVDQFVLSASQQTPASSVDPPSTEQSQSDVPISTCIEWSIPLPGNQLRHAASEATQVTCGFANPMSTEQSQPEAPSSTCLGREPSNERVTFLQQLEAQMLSPVEDRNEPFDHSGLLPGVRSTHTTAELSQVPAQPHVIGQTEVLNHFIPRSDAQSRLNLPTESSINGSGSRLSESRSMSLLPELLPLPPHISPVSSRVSQQSFSDPLQNELGRIRRQEEQTIRLHEDEKLRLKSELEKEMEEIRMKYNTMLEDAEREFLHKKKTLETNYNIVYMNRILAEAFRLKCDARTAAPPGTQQGAPSGSMQQVMRVSLPQVAQRPCTIPGPSTVLTAAPPVQMVHQPSLLSSSTVRSQFGQGFSQSGNHQIGTELRSPAPHLQAYRPMTSVSAPSLLPISCMLPGQQSLCNPSTASVHPQRISRPPTHMSGPFSRSHQQENIGGLQGSQKSSSSRLELFMDMEVHPSPNSQTLLPPLQDIGQTSESREHREQRMAGSLRAPAICTDPTIDVVCLSDDD